MSFRLNTDENNWVFLTDVKYHGMILMEDGHGGDEDDYYICNKGGGSGSSSDDNSDPTTTTTTPSQPSLFLPFNLGNFRNYYYSIFPKFHFPTTCEERPPHRPRKIPILNSNLKEQWYIYQKNQHHHHQQQQSSSSTPFLNLLLSQILVDTEQQTQSQQQPTPTDGTTDENNNNQSFNLFIQSIFYRFLKKEEGWFKYLRPLLQWDDFNDFLEMLHTHPLELLRTLHGDVLLFFLSEVTPINFVSVLSAAVSNENHDDMEEENNEERIEGVYLDLAKTKVFAGEYQKNQFTIIVHDYQRVIVAKEENQWVFFQTDPRLMAFYDRFLEKRLRWFASYTSDLVYACAHIFSPSIQDWCTFTTPLAQSHQLRIRWFIIDPINKAHVYSPVTHRTYCIDPSLWGVCVSKTPFRCHTSFGVFTIGHPHTHVEEGSGSGSGGDKGGGRTTETSSSSSSSITLRTLFLDIQYYFFQFLHQQQQQLQEEPLPTSITTTTVTTRGNIKQDFKMGFAYDGVYKNTTAIATALPSYTLKLKIDL